MSYVRHVFLLVIFSVGLLAGLQAPGFVDQYAKRIDAHAIEARESFKGFQKIADLQFGGDVEALIAKHSVDNDETFRAEAKPIKNGFERLQRFERESSIMRNIDIWQRVKHLVLAGDRETITETYKNFSPVIVLDKQSAICGISVAAGLYLLFVIVFLFGAQPGRKKGNKSEISTNARREAFQKKYFGKK